MHLYPICLRLLSADSCCFSSPSSFSLSLPNFVSLNLSLSFLVFVLFLSWSYDVPPFHFVVLFAYSSRRLADTTCTREVADSRTWGIFIRDTAYFIVIQWSIRSFFIESQLNTGLNTPYPIWKCLTYGSPQRPYCLPLFNLLNLPSRWILFDYVHQLI